ncbi:hypothetical protein Q31b_11030 [Novipirellula aureliae]|uniref:Uncharacterized protein n=1 Tax=Novipirellula aureliae TaxID=2527966 RepID=A0A5C6ED74_9BACT|nr:hypothetical protein [Novipirellula aureliae]TWU45927.1 hypothetical protein Q31b_11030 [Novipirellula aureliae]
MTASQFDAFSDPDVPKRKSSDSARYRSRPFLGVEFVCCSFYGRIYQNAAGTAYVGNCPRCARPITVKIGPGGSSTRFFRAS